MKLENHMDTKESKSVVSDQLISFEVYVFLSESSCNKGYFDIFSFEIFFAPEVPLSLILELVTFGRKPLAVSLIMFCDVL